LLGELEYLEDFHMALLCTECKEDMNKTKKCYFILPKFGNDLSAAFTKAISNLINKHQEQSPDCITGSYTIEKYPNTLIMLKEPETH
jgi:hypothetical protein